ncbi:PREDICTED: uncharacterized protein LOC104833180 [Haliaeetus leucocephalus]|uniref:uncharacterized protein LOC104833180 n=1 Tax=Haliaeetus leucocephalus TaxID=52644 RepID=UPI00053CC5C5|nr:PREDICTED: uncharacterized protein LOC104833180 [Haliaeetus leucocephalus]
MGRPKRGGPIPAPRAVEGTPGPRQQDRATAWPLRQRLRFVSAISRDISQLSCCKLGASWGFSARAARDERSEASPRSVAQHQTLLSLCSGAGAQVGPDFELQQPQDKVSVAAGETLTLTCTMSAAGPLGPVKWLKGWGSGNKTVYDQTGTFPRVTRVVSHSNTDFSIRIRDVRPEDAGTYYCVKFNKMVSGVEMFRHGKGTVVSLHDRALVPSMVAAAVLLCFLVLLGLFVTLCIYRRKRRGEAESQRLARLAAVGSFLPIRLRCCAGTPGTPRSVRTTSSFCTPSNEIMDAETSHLPCQQSSKEDNDIHYADLQPLPTAPRHSRTPGAACSEYASIRVAAK